MTDYSDWIGRKTRRVDTIGEREIARFRATLPGMLAQGAVPPGFHWTLAPDLAEPADLGRDGHPKPGIFVPALPLPRRMWAGGEISYHGDLNPGDTVVRDTTVSDIAFKTGSTGQLGFVTVHHDWSVDGKAVVRERHDIVYREDPKPGSAVTPTPAEDWVAEKSWSVTPDSVLLFRYSALTFNGHRIHYDQPYATGVEGYAGLVVHGPLQATWMLNLATDLLGRLPARFRYRGLSPLTAGIPVTVEARRDGADIALRVRKGDGVVTMQATATP